MKSQEGIEMVECPTIDRDDIEMDPSGWWFLIRPNFRYGHIEVACCNNEAPRNFDGKRIALIAYGRSAQDICHYIFNSLYDNKKMVTTLAHAAYLGKELKKAELHLALGIKDGYQE